MTCLAIIPARGGSRGIPRKNLRPLCGKPLIAHIIGAARASGVLDRVIVSTEDPDIASVAREEGAEVPFSRPANLARDETPTLPVLRHAIGFLEEAEGYRPDYVVLLYPTSPLLRPERIREAVLLAREGGLDSVLAVVEDRGHFWIRQGDTWDRLYPREIANRQLVPPLYRETGALYLATRALLMGENRITGGKMGFILMGRDETVDIDEPGDWELAEFLMERRIHGRAADRRA